MYQPIIMVMTTDYSSEVVAAKPCTYTFGVCSLSREGSPQFGVYRAAHASSTAVAKMTTRGAFEPLKVCQVMTRKSVSYQQCGTIELQ